MTKTGTTEPRKKRYDKTIHALKTTLLPTHHSDGEVVVYNAVRHWVPSLLLVCGCDINLPAIQHYFCTVLDVPQDLQETLALVASGRMTEDMSNIETGLSLLVSLCCYFVTCSIISANH